MQTRKAFKKLGPKLQEIRVNRNLTQREIAQACGFTTAQFVSNIERGISPPSHCYIHVLSEKTGIKVDKLLDVITPFVVEDYRERVKSYNL